MSKKEISVLDIRKHCSQCKYYAIASQKEVKDLCKVREYSVKMFKKRQLCRVSGLNNCLIVDGTEEIAMDCEYFIKKLPKIIKFFKDRLK